MVAQLRLERLTVSIGVSVLAITLISRSMMSGIRDINQRLDTILDRIEESRKTRRSVHESRSEGGGRR